MRLGSEEPPGTWVTLATASWCNDSGGWGVHIRKMGGGLEEPSRLDRVAVTTDLVRARGWDPTVEITPKSLFSSPPLNEKVMGWLWLVFASGEG